MYSLKNYPKSKSIIPVGIFPRGPTSEHWSRQEINYLYQKLNNGDLIERAYGEEYIIIKGEQKFIEDQQDKDEIVNSILFYKSLFDKYLDVDDITIYDKGYYKYYTLLHFNKQFTLIIKDNDLPEIKKQVEETGIKASIENGFIIIPRNDLIRYYVLSILLNNFFTTEEIYGKHYDLLHYFLENKPDFIPSYLSYRLTEYPRFLKLVEDEPTYQDLIISYGLRYIDSELYPGLELIIFVDSILARPEKMTLDEYKKVLKLLFMMPDSPDVIRRRNKIYELAVGLPMNVHLPFDIKLDIDTLLKFGSLYKDIIH